MITIRMLLARMTAFPNQGLSGSSSSRVLSAEHPRIGLARRAGCPTGSGGAAAGSVHQVERPAELVPRLVTGRKGGGPMVGEVEHDREGVARLGQVRHDPRLVVDLHRPVELLP